MGTDDTSTLDTLLEAVALAVLAARPAPPDSWATVQVYPSPCRAVVAFRDNAGRVAAVDRVTGDLALADALADFCNGVLAGLPADVRRKVSAQLAGGAELMALVDVDSRMAVAALVPRDGSEAEPVLLAALRREDIVH